MTNHRNYRNIKIKNIKNGKKKSMKIYKYTCRKISMSKM